MDRFHRLCGYLGLVSFSVSFLFLFHCNPISLIIHFGLSKPNCKINHFMSSICSAFRFNRTGLTEPNRKYNENSGLVWFKLTRTESLPLFSVTNCHRMVKLLICSFWWKLSLKNNRHSTLHSLPLYSLACIC